MLDNKNFSISMLIMGNTESSMNNEEYIEEQKKIIKTQQEQIQRLSQMNQGNQRFEIPQQLFNTPPPSQLSQVSRPKIDPYKILGIGKQYDESSLKKAYLKKALVTHPDRGGNEDDFQTVTLAFNVLLKKLNSQNNSHEHHELRSGSNDFMKEQSEETSLYQNLSKKFDSNAFNKIYEENRVEDVYDDGYTEWIKGNKVEQDGPSNIMGGNYNHERFNDHFQKAKQEQQKKIGKQLVKYDEPEVNISYKGKDSLMTLGQGKITDFSGESGGLVYRDYKDAYTNTFLIDETSVDTSGRPSNIQEQKGSRAKISYEMNSEDQLRESMKMKEEEKAEEARIRRLKEFEEKSFDAYDRVHQRLLGN